MVSCSLHPLKCKCDRYSYISCNLNYNQYINIYSTCKYIRQQTKRAMTRIVFSEIINTHDNQAIGFDEMDLQKPEYLRKVSLCVIIH